MTIPLKKKRERTAQIQHCIINTVMVLGLAATTVGVSFFTTFSTFSSFTVSFLEVFFVQLQTSPSSNFLPVLFVYLGFKELVSNNMGEFSSTFGFG